jgi:hypothetical protein
MLRHHNIAGGLRDESDCCNEHYHCINTAYLFSRKYRQNIANILQNPVLVTTIREDIGMLATHRGIEKAGRVLLYVQGVTNTN